jgi:hypothetical protein
MEKYVFDPQDGFLQIAQGEQYAPNQNPNMGKVPMTAPVLDEQFNKWHHATGNICTCGCSGGWSASADSLIE